MEREKWLTIDELSTYLKIGRTKLYQMAQDNLIPASKIGSLWRFDKDEVDVWLKEKCRNEKPVTKD